MKPRPEINEQEAVETIAGWIAPHVDETTTEASRLELCRAIYDAIHSGEKSLEEAVAAALAGDPYVDRALRHLSRDYLASGHLPAPLCEFIAAALFMEGPPSFPPGRHALNLRNRDAAIPALVEQTIERWGVDATRNVATETPCACSLVADALQRCGLDIKEGQVAKVFAAKQRSHLLNY